MLSGPLAYLLTDSFYFDDAYLAALCFGSKFRGSGPRDTALMLPMLAELASLAPPCHNESRNLLLLLLKEGGGVNWHDEHTPGV